MITTVTLNPMLDKTVYVDSIQRGHIHRASKIETIAGGKGINVSRQLKTLGAETRATGFLGGEIGAIVSHLLTAENISHDFVITDTMTREGVTYREADGNATAMFEPIGHIGVNFVHQLNAKINQLAQQSAWIVCSGSSPGYEADDLFYEAIVNGHKFGAFSVLDSYGNAFTLALKAMPSLVKPNKQELEQTFGMKLASDTDFRSALDGLLDKGIQYCIITDGANPSYAAIRGHYWKITSPQVVTVNPVGSGDAMVAGILYGFTQGWKFQRCLSFGAAAGAANAQKWSVANSTLEEILKLEQEVAVQRLR